MKLENTKAISMNQLETVAGGGYFHHPDHGRMALPPMRPIIPISPVTPVFPHRPALIICTGKHSSAENTQIVG